MSIPSLKIPVDLDLDSLQKQGAAAADFVGSALQEITSSFSDANSQMTGIAGQAQTVFAGMSSSVTFATLGIAGAALAANKLMEAFAGIAGEVGDIARQAQYLNTTTEDFQVLRFAGAKAGIAPEQAGKDLENTARLLNDAQRNENSLTKLLDANNVKYKDRNGQLVAMDDLLQKGGQLVANAGSYADKVEIAKMLGLTQQWIPALEQVAQDGFGKIAEEANKSGVIIDAETIEKAAEFSRAWKESASVVSLQLQAAFFDIANSIDLMIQKLGDLINKAADAKGIADAAATQAKADRYFDYLFGGGSSSSSAPIRITIPPPRTGATDPLQAGGPRTIVPSKDTGDSEDAFQRQIEQIQKRTKEYQAETTAVGLNTEAKTRLKAIADLNAAADRAGIDLTAKQKEQILQLADAEGKAAQAAADAKEKFKGQNDAIQFGGNQLIDIVDGLRTKSMTAQQAMQQLLNTTIKALEQAALLGTGPLAGLFGTTAAAGSGGTGGLLGMLFGVAGRADGGPAPGGAFRGVGTGRSDSNLVMLSDGEYVVNAEAAKRWGAWLDAINFSGAYANGGGVSSVSPSIAPGGADQVVNVEIVNKAGANVSVASKTRGPDGSLNMKVLVDQIESTIASRVAGGGSVMNRSLEGRYGVNPVAGSVR